MTLIETVKRLQEMEQTKGGDHTGCQAGRDLLEYLRAAPAMLDVLNCFREGDAEMLRALIDIETESAKFVAGFGKVDAAMQRIIDMLKRLQEGARRIEE